SIFRNTKNSNTLNRINPIIKSCFTEFPACDGTRKRQLSIPPQAESHFPMKQHSIVMKKAVTRQTIAGATAIFHNLFQ
ncbi:hypothetical protein, partial [Gallintestinimicrobium sp.]|uniref:hypothetical protein n=1 Tax=Gallintestinimicrobium sp. TaxID=2981655 RepID=UPI00307C8B0A